MPDEILSGLTAVDGIQLAIAAIVGALLGLFYYGGLWWTVNRMQRVKQPGLLFAVSFLVRTVGVIAGLFLVSGGDWLPILFALVPFIAVRMLLTRRWGPAVEK